MPHRLVVVDGYLILYRAFFGLPPLNTSQGAPTNAVFGFASTLLRLLEDPANDAVAVVFDAPSRTFRHEADATYKATRASTPDELSLQIPVAHEVVAALNLPVLMEHGVEGDDVIGSLASHAAASGWDVLILTSDGDACQLVNDSVHILCPRRGMDLVTLDEAAVEERYGIPPRRIPDWKALCGDASDNIPGVPSIGPKTATALLQQFGTLDALFSRLEEVKNERTRSALCGARDRVFLSRHLASIRTNVPLKVDLGEWRTRRPNEGRVRDLFTRLEFRSLLRRLFPPPAARTTFFSSPADLSGTDYAPAPPFSAEAWAAEGADPQRPVAVWLQAAPDGSILAAYSTAPGVARFLPPDDLESLRALLEDPSVPKVLHDLKATLHLLWPMGIQLRGVVGDTALASYLLNPGRGHHRLDEILFECLGVDVAAGERPADASSANVLSAGGLAACQMADCLGRSWDVLSDRLRAEGMDRLLTEMELPLAPVLAEMEREGVALDVPRLQAISELLTTEIASLEEEIYRLAGESFNIHSPKQLGQVLFEKLGLGRGRSNRTGPSTDAETLQALAPLHPLPERVLAYRELSKLKSTYTDRLAALVRPETGRVHTSLNQMVTATGRLSSSDPNLQNIPVRSGIGREIRRAFVPRPGWLLLSVDYSQIELRLLAHMTGDRELQRAFCDGEDIHRHTAASVYGIPVDAVTDEMRRRAKAINFGLMYGMSSFGLASDLGLSRVEARSYIQQYFARFPGVQSYVRDAINTAQALGFASTLLGRRRGLPEINSRKHNLRQMAERAAVNTPIQGAAADLMKAAMLRVHRELSSRDLQAKMILQVHDELVFELPEEELSLVARLVKEAMEHAMALDVPLVVEASVGRSWGEMRPWPPAPETPVSAFSEAQPVSKAALVSEPPALGKLPAKVGLVPDTISFAGLSGSLQESLAAGS